MSTREWQLLIQEMSVWHREVQMLKAALIAYGALTIPGSFVALALCRAAARSDEMTEAALRLELESENVSVPKPQSPPRSLSAAA